MKVDEKDMLNSILESISRIDYIKAEDIPNIELYMDQVTTFMESQLESTKRYPEDKILTKTMINNYAKNHLLPPPVKKKYSKEHVLLLIFIYYFKNLLSIKDIETLLAPIAEKDFNNGEEFSLTDIYEEVCQLQKSRIDSLSKDVARKFQVSSESFADAPEDEQEYLKLFSFICSLAFDVYVKKQLIEKLIDTLPEPDHKKK
ncbi:DUF1836 domain-containing protein [Sporofaciens sp. SGI.106]|uniref:DUF1836 domain-containing protein n=1 Tax=Sporofaciens sp. SGI.106 TaxID=3420568 RepID=UPI002A9485BA|nr:DUF1836 domain-containing protein [Lachnoclostridium sp.]